MYRVVIVDDESMPRRILAQQVESQIPGFVLAGAFKTGDLAWEYLQQEEADILITDIRMPGISGIELARRVLTRWPDTVIGIITGYSEFEYARHAIALGVSSFLLKPINLNEFRNAMEHMGRQRQEKLQFKAMQRAVPQDAMDEFISDMQESPLRPEERSARFRACGFPFPEEACRGSLMTVQIEKTDKQGSAEQEYNAVTNVLRMNFPSYFFFPIGQENGQITFLTLYSDGLPEWRAERCAGVMKDALRYQVSARQDGEFRGLGELQRIFTLMNNPRQEQRESSQEQQIHLALQYIEAHYQEDITRYDVAKHLYLNPGYFGRLFKQQLDESFSDYLVKLRMQKAIELLFSSYSVAQISAMVGYANPSSFTRVFRLYTSYTPTEYRQFVIRRCEPGGKYAE